MNIRTKWVDTLGDALSLQPIDRMKAMALVCNTVWTKGLLLAFYRPASVQEVFTDVASLSNR